MSLPDFSLLEQKINITFRDKELLQQAFTHRSYINENKSAKEHNERLEFLGDAVLELAATAFLFKKYPNKNEGDLTSYRAALVNTNTLSKVSADLGFGDFLLLSKGESKDTGRARQYILADNFEAVIGAIYLDQGYEVAYSFIDTYLLSLTEDIVNNGSFIDAKSFLQEKSQEVLSAFPCKFRSLRLGVAGALLRSPCQLLRLTLRARDVIACSRYVPAYVAFVLS